MGLLLVAAALGVVYGRRLRDHGLTVHTAFESGPRGWIFLVSMLLVVGSIYALFKFTGWLSPETSGFLQGFVWAYFKANVAFLTGMALPLSVGSKVYRLGVVAIALLAVTMIQRAEAWVFAPVYSTIHEQRRAPDGSVLQTLDTSCTAAALANLLPLYGRKGSEADCARALQTTRFGTTIGNLIQGLGAFGLHGYYVKADPDTLVRMNRPALLTVWSSGGMRHSVALVGAEGSSLRLIDPLIGRVVLSQDDVARRLADSRAVVMVDEALPPGDPQAVLLHTGARARPGLN